MMKMPDEPTIVTGMRSPSWGGTFPDDILAYIDALKAYAEAMAEALKVRSKQIGVACIKHDLIHSLVCGHCHAELTADRDRLAAECAALRKKLDEVSEVMRDNGIETQGWIEHTGHDGKLVRDDLTVAATLMFWFDAVRENKITPFTEPKPDAARSGHE